MPGILKECACLSRHGWMADDPARIRPGVALPGGVFGWQALAYCGQLRADKRGQRLQAGLQGWPADPRQQAEDCQKQKPAKQPAAFRHAKDGGLSPPAF